LGHQSSFGGGSVFGVYWGIAPVSDLVVEAASLVAGSQHVGKRQSVGLSELGAQRFPLELPPPRRRIGLE